MVTIPKPICSHQNRVTPSQVIEYVEEYRNFYFLIQYIEYIRSQSLLPNKKYTSYANSLSSPKSTYLYFPDKIYIMINGNNSKVSPIKI